MKTSPIWLTEDVKYKYKDGWYVAELREPWDLMLEGHLLNHHLGAEYHIAVVKTGDERMFSIRDENEYPHITILTTPTDARDWWGYAPVRGLQCSAPMKVDDQDLYVIEVLVNHNKTAMRHGPSFARALEFYEEMGGKPEFDVPSGNLYSGIELKTWRKYFRDELPRILVVATNDSEVAMAKEAKADLIVYSLEEVKSALRWGNFKSLFVPREFKQRKDLTDFMTKFNLRPKDVFAYYAPKPKSDTTDDSSNGHTMAKTT